MKINVDVVLPIIASFFISIILSIFIIPFLRKLNIGQTVRKEGVKTHRKKNGTPTMGGLIIVIAIVITAGFYVERYPDITPVLFLMIGFGCVGFLDDYLKVLMKRAEGLTPFQKMMAQLFVTTIFACYLFYNKHFDFCTYILPFSDGQTITLPIWCSVLLLYFAVLGTVNGVNFTDGLDGLAASVTVLVAVFFSVVSIGTKSGIEPITCATAGSLLGFLLFNVYPARVFMGDTGSLALGGFVVATAYMLHLPFYILLVGIIYVIEVLSVILQVQFFRMTKGRRLFKMAPLHHHFELCGHSETQIVTMFSIVTAFACLMALVV